MRYYLCHRMRELLCIFLTSHGFPFAETDEQIIQSFQLILSAVKEQNTSACDKEVLYLENILEANVRYINGFIFVHCTTYEDS